jgi:hypothetical protein
MQLGVAHEEVREQQHEERRDEVVEEEDDPELARRAEGLAHLAEAHVGHGRVHHQESPDGHPRLSARHGVQNVPRRWD